MTAVPKGVGTDGFVRKTYTSTLAPQDIDLEARTSSPVITTMEPDRDKELVLPEAILDYLGVYLANPKFLWGHRRDGDPEETMGRTLEFQPIDGGWKAKFYHDTADVNPKADMVWKQIVAGSQRGYSICFLPVEWVTRQSPKDKIAALPAQVRDWLLRGLVTTVYTVVEILEISAVHVPSNRKALLKSIKEAITMAKSVAKGNKVLNADNMDHTKQAISCCEMAVRKACAGMGHLNEIHKSAGGEDLYPSDFPVPEMDPDEEEDVDPELELEGDDERDEEDDEKGKSTRARAVKKDVHIHIPTSDQHPLTKDVANRLRTAADSLEGSHPDRVAATRGILKSCDGDLANLMPATAESKGDDAAANPDLDGTQPQNVAMAAKTEAVSKSVETPTEVTAETAATTETTTPPPTIAPPQSVWDALYEDLIASK